MRLLGLSGALDCAGREGREVFRPRFVDGTAWTSREPAVVRSLFKVEGLRPRLLLILARLGDRAGGPPESLAAEAAVGAVAEEGRRTGLVGDRGLGFDVIEVDVVFLPTLALTEADDCLGFGAAPMTDFVVIEARLDFSFVDSFDSSLRGLLDDTGCFGD